MDSCAAPSRTRSVARVALAAGQVPGLRRRPSRVAGLTLNHCLHGDLTHCQAPLCRRWGTLLKFRPSGNRVIGSRSEGRRAGSVPGTARIADSQWGLPSGADPQSSPPRGRPPPYFLLLGDTYLCCAVAPLSRKPDTLFHASRAPLAAGHVPSSGVTGAAATHPHDDI